MQKRSKTAGRYYGWRMRREKSGRAETEQKTRAAEALHSQTELVRLLQDVAVAANESDSVLSALQFAVNRLCKYLKWPVGHALLLEDDGAMYTANIWHSDLPTAYQPFRDQTSSLRFPAGFGLPGEVLAVKSPVWISNMWQDRIFQRKSSVETVGLKTGLGIPLVAAREVVGVLEFFHPKEIPPDPGLLAVLPHIGIQLGRVIERQRAQNSLRKTAAQMRLIITSLPLILWVTDREGRLIMLEGRGVPAVGLDPQELIGHNLFEQMKSRPDVVGMMRRALAGEDIHSLIYTAKGEAFETFFTPYYDADWAVDGVIGLSFEVTRRMQMEANLEEMKHRLLDSVENERARLGQQIHDGPLQDLFGAYYQIQEIQQGLDPAAKEVADRALQTIQEVNATLRLICGELRPSTLVHLGLPRAIRSHAERMQEIGQPGTGEAAPAIHLDLPENLPSPVLPYALRLSLFRVYQQLISNALQHANASNVWIRLKFLPEEVFLEIEDDGKGFSVPRSWVELVRQGRIGLTSAMERVEGLGGTIDFQTEPGRGTRIRVRVPHNIVKNDTASNR